MDVRGSTVPIIRDPVAAVIGGTAAAIVTGGIACLVAASAKARTPVLVAATALGAVVGAAVGGVLIGRPVSAPTYRDAAVGADTLRVMTINIHQSVPNGRNLGDANEEPGVIADVARYVRGVDADIVFVQEVDDDIPGHGGVARELDLLRTQFEASGWAYTPAVDGDFPDRNNLTADRDRYGIAMFTRNGIKLENVSRATLSHSEGMEARQMLQGTAVLPDGRRMTIVDTHLDHTGHDRPAQLEDIARRLDSIEGPVIVGGDFNTGADTADAALATTGLDNVLSSEWARSVEGTEAGKAARAATYQDTRIDHIYTSDGLGVLQTFSEQMPMVETRHGSAVSDHRPVVADIDIASITP